MKKAQYKTRQLLEIEDFLKNNENKHDTVNDIILFFSPYGIRSVKELYPDFEQGDRVVGSFGSLTTESLKERGIRVDFTAPTPECPSMVVALEKYLSEHAE